MDSDSVSNLDGQVIECSSTVHQLLNGGCIRRELAHWQDVDTASGILLLTRAAMRIERDRAVSAWITRTVKHQNQGCSSRHVSALTLTTSSIVLMRPRGRTPGTQRMFVPLPYSLQANLPRVLGEAAEQRREHYHQAPPAAFEPIARCTIRM